MRKDRTGSLLLGYVLLYVGLAVGAGTFVASRPSSPSTVRIGARCFDGWPSSATGSGACSHHGGVAEWLYATSPQTASSSSSDPSGGYLSSLIFVLLGGVLVLYAKSVEQENQLASAQTVSGSPVRAHEVPLLDEPSVKPIQVNDPSPNSPDAASADLSYRCECGSWMFKSKDLDNHDILRCVRTEECGGTKLIT